MEPATKWPPTWQSPVPGIPSASLTTQPTQKGTLMGVYGSPPNADQVLPDLTGRQEVIRLRICSTRATLHDRLVALQALRAESPADKEAVRAWLFANQPDEIRRGQRRHRTLER